jgi:hypothetical protein
MSKDFIIEIEIPASIPKIEIEDFLLELIEAKIQTYDITTK